VIECGRRVSGCAKSSDEYVAASQTSFAGWSGQNVAANAWSANHHDDDSRFFD
jgi:hypothetical protein